MPESITNDQIVTEAIILAGGLGTRLREAVPDLPKCMAPVAGKPFLSYAIDRYACREYNALYFPLAINGR